VPQRTAEWGFDIARAISDVGTGYWWTSLFPGLAILGLVTGLSLLGEGVNDVLNPRLRQAGIGPGDPAESAVGPGGAVLIEVADEPAIVEPPTAAGEELWATITPVAHVDRAPEPPSSRRAGPPVLELNGLSVTYRTHRGPVTAVDGVSLTVGAGESVGLVGESGCGKSSLGRAALGVLPPGAEMSGRVVVDGTELGPEAAGWRQARGERIALVFQDPATRLDPLQQVEAHFVETIRAHRPETPVRQARRMAAASLAAVGVPPARARQYPHEFSGGMRQRIMLALAVVLEPRVLVADEPTTSLDVLVEAQVLRLLDGLRQQLGIGVVLITHNLGIVAETCDRVAVMYAGQIVESGPVTEVFAHPRHPYTQGLLASVISLSSTELVSVPGSPPDLADPPPGCRFAPRCPLAMTTCSTVEPVPAQVSPTHSVACHLYPGADPTHPDRAWAPGGRRRRLGDQPLAGELV
jgi:oligopeptide/dipeptide ABC transporter ATP-binding protein